MPDPEFPVEYLMGLSSHKLAALSFDQSDYKLALEEIRHLSPEAEARYLTAYREHIKTMQVLASRGT
ncbi:MAG: hypothetical protein AAF376_07075 [Pseudomonadota bacterium]